VGVRRISPNPIICFLGEREEGELGGVRTPRGTPGSVWCAGETVDGVLLWKPGQDSVERQETAIVMCLLPSVLSVRHSLLRPWAWGSREGNGMQRAGWVLLDGMQMHVV